MENIYRECELALFEINRTEEISPSRKKDLRAPIHAIQHEARLFKESVTGSFYYDPAQVRSRKIAGG